MSLPYKADTFVFKKHNYVSVCLCEANNARLYYTPRIRNDAMDKERYLEELTKEIRKAGYKKLYTSKCLKYAERLLDNKLPVIFDTKHLSLLIGIEPSNLTKMVFAAEKHYNQIRIPKKAGGYRELDIPSYDLKYIQHWILDNILYHIPVSDYAYGFLPNKSIVDNAKIHLGKHCVVNMDIKDFFPSISFDRVFRIFDYYGYTKEISFVLSKLCTYQGKLPQGSPASPYISNIACKKLDARLSALAKAYEADYSRYADDITFSGTNDIKKIEVPSTSIINDEGLELNEKKTHISYPHERQEVTGLVVNGDHVSIPREYKRSLQQELYYCMKYGVEDHMKRIGCGKAFYKEHLYGKIYFIKMVEPIVAEKYFKLANQINWDY